MAVAALFSSHVIMASGVHDVFKHHVQMVLLWLYLMVGSVNLVPEKHNHFFLNGRIWQKITQPRRVPRDLAKAARCVGIRSYLMYGS